MTVPVSSSPTITDDFDFEAYGLQRPLDRRPGPLTILKRNQLNRLAEEHNRKIRETIITRHKDGVEDPGAGLELKAYYGYTDTELANLVYSEIRCQEWGPLPDFLRAKVNKMRLENQGVKVEEKHGDIKMLGNDEMKTHRQWRLDQAPKVEDGHEDCKWKKEQDGFVKNEAGFEKEDTNISGMQYEPNPTESSMTVSQDDMEVDTGYQPMRSETPPMHDFDFRSPSPTLTGARTRSEAPSTTPEPTSRARKRTGSPLPEASTRTLRPRTTKDYRELNADGSLSNDIDSRSTPERQTRGRTASPAPESEQNSSMPSNGQISTRRARAAAKAKLPELQPGDEMSLDREEYFRRTDREVTVKVEEDAINLHNTLRPVPPDLFLDLDLDLDEQAFAASRKCWTGLYGGNPQQTYVTATKQEIEKYREMAFFNCDFNPDAPRRPGESGLLLGSIADPEYVFPSANREPDRRVVVTKVGTNKWRLIGLSEIKDLDTLQPHEWLKLSPKVRQTWVKNINTRQWGVEFKARIWLRKELGQEPTWKQVADAVDAEVALVGTRTIKDPVHFEEVTLAEIEETFNTGLSRIIVYTVECVEYPIEIQRRVIAEAPNYVSLPKPKGKTVARKATTLSKRKQPGKAAGKATKVAQKTDRKVVMESSQRVTRSGKKLTAAR